MTPQNTAATPAGAAGTAPPATPQNAGDARMFGGITLTFDFTRDGQQTQAEPAAPNNALGDIPDANLLNGGGSLTEFLMRIGMFTQLLGAAGGLGGYEDKEDPERAKKLVAGLEEVPIGLVKRLVKVGGSGGGMGEDDSKGGDAGCAICWDSLLVEEMDESTESVEQPKIVSLPCAHVFHADCLVPWFSRPRQTTCPSCRFNIDPDNLTYVSWRQRRQQQREREQAEGQASGGEDNIQATPATDTQEPTNPAPTPSTSTTPEPPSIPANSTAGPQAPPTRDRLIPIPIVVPITVPASALSGLDDPPAPLQPTAGPSAPVADAPAPAASAPRSTPRVRMSTGGFAPFARGFSRFLSESQGTPSAAGQAPATPTPGTFTSTPPTQPPANGGRTRALPHAHFGTIDIGNGLQADILSFGFDVVIPPQPGQQNRAEGQQAIGNPPNATPSANPNPAVNASDPPPPPPTFLNIFQSLLQGPPEPGMPPPADGAAQPAPDANQRRDEYRDQIEALLRDRMGPPPQATNSATPQADHTGDTRTPHGPAFFGGITFGGGGGAGAGTGPGVDGLNPTDFFGHLLSQTLPTFGPMPAPTPAAGTHPVPQDRPRSRSQPPLPTQPPLPADGAANPTPPPPPQGTAPNQRRAALLDLLTLLSVPLPGSFSRSETEERPKRPWTLPPAPGPTLRQRIERREREAGLRCCDVSCGIGPSDEEPELTEVAAKMTQLSIKAQDGSEVCSHRFHSSCLVSAERVALQGEDAPEEDGAVAVSCPVCRGSGSVKKQEWDEGVASLS